MPANEYVWLPRTSILSFEEIARAVGVFTAVGVTKVRITGGEPLLRQQLPGLVRLLARNRDLDDLAMTTNGTLLARYAAPLKEAGLQRITLSLDTLDEGRARQFARNGKLGEIFRGVDVAREVGFTGLKINSVIVRGVNDDEVIDLFEFASAKDAELRYIEYMDVGGATDWSMDTVVTRQEILETLDARYGPIDAVTGGSPSAPAERFRTADGRVFGIVASTTAPFCRTCDRGRLTADGVFYTCLYADAGVDLRELLRAGASEREIADVIGGVWDGRSDRGAEERLGLESRGVLYQIDGLRADPHREMHTRGG